MLIALENHLRYFELLWGATRAGLYYTTLSTHLKADEIRYIDLTTPATNGVVTTTPATAAPPNTSNPNSLFLALAPSGTATVVPDRKSTRLNSSHRT